MKAAIQERYGPPEVVQVRDVERPEPTGDQVLVRVRAASVNRADLDGLEPRPGFIRPFIGIRAPRNTRVGIDVAGEVEAVGPDATRFRPGDGVFADMFTYGGGAFAEYVCAPEKAFEPMPAGMSFEDAATLPHSAILALQGLRLRNGRTPRPGRQGPDRRRVGQRRAVRRPDREVDGRRGDRRRQHGQARLRSLARRRPRHRLHEGRLHEDRRALRLDPRHRLPPLDPPVRRALRPNGVYVTLGGTTWPILDGMIVGPLSRLAATGSRG